MHLFVHIFFFSSLNERLFACATNETKWPQKWTIANGRMRTHFIMWICIAFWCSSFTWFYALFCTLDLDIICIDFCRQNNNFLVVFFFWKNENIVNEEKCDYSNDVWFPLALNVSMRDSWWFQHYFAECVNRDWFLLIIVSMPTATANNIFTAIWNRFCEMWKVHKSMCKIHQYEFKINRKINFGSRYACMYMWWRIFW